MRRIFILFSDWFRGWSHHGGYNRQPNDDGYSGQDCVEIRRAFFLPGSQSAAPMGPAVGAPAPAREAPSPTTSGLDTSFRWNDRNCNVLNHFLCARPLAPSGSGADAYKNSDCGREVVLHGDQLSAVVTSPGFPGPYPDYTVCETVFTAPPGYRLFVDFDDFNIEKGEQ